MLKYIENGVLSAILVLISSLGLISCINTNNYILIFIWISSIIVNGCAVYFSLFKK